MTRRSQCSHYFRDNLYSFFYSEVNTANSSVSGETKHYYLCVVRGKPVLFRTVGIYFFCRLCNWVLVRWQTPRGNVMLATKHEFQWINAPFSNILLHTSALVRRVAFGSWTSNWSSCFLQIPCIVPKLLYGVYADSAFTLCVELSVLSTISMYQDSLCATMTGAPLCEKVVVMTWKKHLSISCRFQYIIPSCASCCVCLITSSIDSCFPQYLKCCCRWRNLAYQ